MIRYAPLALCLLALPAWADTYKWTDEKGIPQYSDHAPPATVKNVETIKQVKPPAAGATPEDVAIPKKPPPSAASQETEFRKRRLQSAEAEAKALKEAQAAEEKKRNCERAMGQVHTLERGGRISRYAANGEQIFLTDADIAQELPQAKKAADSWCK